MPGYIGTFLPFIAVIVVFYLLILIPDNRRKKKYNNMLSSLKVNDEILTRGGIIGKIINIQDDNIIFQTGPDKVKIKISKSAIGSVLNPTEDITV
ncbi:MAG TPA: preprotein translocase subunit YajC [Clostridiaceae bacterium]